MTEDDETNFDELGLIIKEDGEPVKAEEYYKTPPLSDKPDIDDRPAPTPREIIAHAQVEAINSPDHGVEARQEALKALYQRLAAEAVDVLYVVSEADRKLYSEKPGKAVPLYKLKAIMEIKEL